MGMLFIGLTTLVGCKKEIGPEGPKGEQGVQAEQGQNGDDGNANVIGTNEVTISNWSQSGSAWFADITAQGITQDVVNTGLVQVFIQYGSEWWALPDQSGSNVTSFGYSVGNISLMNQNTDGTTATNPGSGVFRVVIITSSNLTAHPNVDWNDYEQEKQALSLKE